MKDCENSADEILHLRDGGNEHATSFVMMQTEAMKLVRIQLDTNEATEQAWSAGELLIECQSGQVRVQTARGDCLLETGQAKHVAEGVAWSVYALTRSVLTVLEAMHGETSKKPTLRDVVSEASEDSFPASDPPSWTPVTSP